jgi:enamine deaminase RidA (YjgF/YER057c/UK114 family)
LDKKSIVPSAWRTKYDTWHFSPAVESGGFLFVSGCTGTRPDGTISPDVREQTRQAFETVEMSLVEAGASLADVVEIVSYHVKLEEHFEDFCKIKDEFIHEPYPAWTAVGVSELAANGAVIEVKVTAKAKTDHPDIRTQKSRGFN